MNIVTSPQSFKGYLKKNKSNRLEKHLKYVVLPYLDTRRLSR